MCNHFFWIKWGCESCAEVVTDEHINLYIIVFIKLDLGVTILNRETTEPTIYDYQPNRRCLVANQPNSVPIPV